MTYNIIWFILHILHDTCTSIHCKIDVTLNFKWSLSSSSRDLLFCHAIQYKLNICKFIFRELKNGIPVYDKEGNKLGISKVIINIRIL